MILHYLIMPLSLALASVMGLPIRWLLSRGGPGAERAYNQARRELERDGRTLIPAGALGRLFKVGPIELDLHGFTVNGRSRQSYAWTEIQRPFEIVDRTTSQAIVFVVLARKGRLRAAWGRLVRNDTTVLTEAPKQLPCAYKVGMVRLVELMNQMRSRALAEAARR